MQITRTSPFSGQTRTLDLPVTAEQIAAFEGGALIQHAFPNLSAGQREFILTGITDDEWDAALSDDEDLDDEEAAF